MLERYASNVGNSAATLQGMSLADATLARNAWIEIDLAALEANLAAMRRAVGPTVELFAVVKANAYGHGAAPVSRTLEQAGVDRFAVAWLDEALALREAGITRPILVLEHTFPASAQAAVASNVDCTVHSRELALALSEAAVVAGRPANVHIKVDTGLHRFGLDAREAIDLARFCRALPGLNVDALWTHMANADEDDDTFSLDQLAQLQAVRDALPWVPHCHAANSATALRRPELRFDAIRTGLALYGLVPANTPDPALTPVLSLKARLARVHVVAAGQGVSYGHTWRAPRDTVVGLVPVGYADGWRRSLGNRGEVLVHGRRCPIVGRVCMDQLLVDLSALPSRPVEGDETVLLGEQGGQRITADEIATLTDTISWEVVAALLPRLPRIAHRAGWVSSVG